MSHFRPECDVVVVGAGPCGLATAITLHRSGRRVEVIEQGCIVQAITQYPTYATFFSTPEKLAIAGVPFTCPDAKPTRRDALAYYRAVVKHSGIAVRQFEHVESIAPSSGGFRVKSTHRGSARETRSRAVVIATGYWGSPNLLGVPGEALPHVHHTFVEGHLAFDQDVVVVGGGNSAAEAALELYRAGARVTLVHFGPTFDKKIKPWIRPDLENRIAEGSIAVRWNTRVRAIDEGAVELQGPAGAPERVTADHVFLLTGFAPNVKLLGQLGVPIASDTGIPQHNPETLETSVPGVYIAGVVIAGFDANKVFIENGRYHGERILASLDGGVPPVAVPISRDLDGG